MSTRYAPHLVSEELLDLTHRLGAPERDLVILAEGNTSELIGGEIVVKASGASMRFADSTSFAVVDVAALAEVIDDPSSDQERLSRTLQGAGEAGTIRASIETLVHVAVRMVSPARFVAHTHPTPVVALLASVQGGNAFEEPVYSDELMVLGRPLHLPYAEPGLALGRLFARRLREHVDEWGDVPSLVLLGNHGIVAISQSVDGADAISTMAVKSARVRLGALQAGGIRGLGQDSTRHYFARPDFAARREALSATTEAAPLQDGAAS